MHTRGQNKKHDYLIKLYCVTVKDHYCCACSKGVPRLLTLSLACLRKRGLFQKSPVVLGSNGLAQRQYFKDSIRCSAVPSHHISNLDAL